MSAERSNGDDARRNLYAVSSYDPAGRLAESLEFLVDCEDGTPFGIVDDVVFDREGTVIGLLVAVGGLGHRRITSIVPSEIVEIRPLERRLVVARRPDVRPRRWWRRLF